MRFEPRTPDETVNVSSLKPLKDAALLTFGLAAVAAPVVMVITRGVDFLAPRIPPEVEHRVFASLALDFAGQVGDDSEQAARIAHAQSLVDRLLVHWAEAPARYQVGLLASVEPNAAAFPGGWILVTEGLLSDVRTENELALVLAHELGHFRNRDHLRRLGRSVVYGLAVAAIVQSGGPALNLATLVGELTGRASIASRRRLRTCSASNSSTPSTDTLAPPLTSSNDAAANRTVSMTSRSICPHTQAVRSGRATFASARDEAAGPWKGLPSSWTGRVEAGSLTRTPMSWPVTGRSVPARPPRRPDGKEPRRENTGSI